jgi:GNAT superfamily N-acetyltransferase
MVQQTQAWPAPDVSQPGKPVHEGVTPIAVDVTFMRMADRPNQPGPALPSGYDIVCAGAPTVGFYRYLYGMVGYEYCWWLRRVASDGDIAAMLADPRIALHVLYHQGEPGGFFELDGRLGVEVNIGYFGLMPHLVGRRVGTAFLRAAIDAAWAQVDVQAGSRPGTGVRVNTCTADHPRALGSYLRAGFKPIRAVREIWNIPDHLGLPIPQHLRA